MQAIKSTADQQALTYQSKLSRILLISWLEVLLVPFLIYTFTFRPYWSPHRMVFELIIIGSIAAISTIIYGYVLDALKLWKQFWLQSFIFATVGLLLCYVIMMIVLNPSDPAVDDEAGLGIGILSVPIAVTVALLMWLGRAVHKAAKK